MKIGNIRPRRMLPIADRWLRLNRVCAVVPKAL
jgi:hypothetical protein